MQSLELDAYIRNSSRDDVPGSCCAAMEILTNHGKATTTRRALLSHQGLHVTNPSVSTDIVFAVSEAAADPVCCCGQASRSESKAALHRAADCPPQEPKGQQANLQDLHMQGCHWVALLKAAESIIPLIRHKCGYIADNCFKLLRFSIAQGHKVGKC